MLKLEEGIHGHENYKCLFGDLNYRRPEKFIGSIPALTELTAPQKLDHR